MKKFDRVLVTLLVVGIWVLVFVFAFSPDLTKARDPLFDDDFERKEREFMRKTESMDDGYTIIGEVMIQTPHGLRDTGTLDCKITER